MIKPAPLPKPIEFNGSVSSLHTFNNLGVKSFALSEYRECKSGEYFIDVSDGLTRRVVAGWCKSRLGVLLNDGVSDTPKKYWTCIPKND